MPVRIGFGTYRRQTLQQELERVIPLMPQLGALKVILTGDLAIDRVGPESSLDLIVVMDIQGDFTRRMDFYTSHLGPLVASNYYVYTPEEFSELKDTNPFLRTALRHGRVVHEA